MLGHSAIAEAPIASLGGATYVATLSASASISGIGIPGSVFAGDLSAVGSISGTLEITDVTNVIGDGELLASGSISGLLEIRLNVHRTANDWGFVPQEAKYGYMNNPRWQYPATVTHIPCGYWLKGSSEVYIPGQSITQGFWQQSIDTNGTIQYLSAPNVEGGGLIVFTNSDGESTLIEYIDVPISIGGVTFNYADGVSGTIVVSGAHLYVLHQMYKLTGNTAIVLFHYLNGVRVNACEVLVEDWNLGNIIDAVGSFVVVGGVDWTSETVDVKYSSNGGVTWNTTKLLAGKASIDVPKVVINQDKIYILAYYYVGSPTYNEYVVVLVSSDWGATFSDPIVISGIDDEDSYNFDICESGNYVYAAFNYWLAGVRKVSIAQFIDGVLTLNSVGVINTGGSRSAPIICCLGDVVCLVLSTKLYRSVDGGASFSLLSELATDYQIPYPDNNVLKSSGSRFVYTSCAFRRKGSDIQGYLLSEDAGATWSFVETPLSFNASDPAWEVSGLYETIDINPIWPFDEQEPKTSNPSNGYWKKN